MALTDKTVGLAFFQQAVQTLEAAACPGLQGIELLQIGLVGEERANLLEILLNRRHHAFWRAQRVLDRHARRLQVELGNLPRHLVDVAGIELAIGLQGVEHLALGELAHLQHVFDRFAFATDLRRFGATGDRQDVQVQAFGQALVQTQLFVAEMPALIQAGEVEKAEVHRLLDLVGVLAGEQDPGDMRLDELEPIHGVRVQGWVLQRSDKGLAHGKSFRGQGIRMRHYGQWCRPCIPPEGACPAITKCV
ncbi:hypothetical protein D3C79_646370 [compost metagenome]